MKNKIKLGITILLIVGVFFRFYNLDYKIYWLDETFTALRVSGYSAPELAEVIPKNQILTIQDIQGYYHPSPDRPFSDVVQALENNAEHAPLYFVILRFWREWFGSSVAVTRSLSAWISLLVFPGVYWLCLELFKSPLTAWIAMGLLAISPFQVLYAQEARQYSLFAVVILFSSAALLKAIRLQNSSSASIKQNGFSWNIYAVSIVFGLYTHLLFVLVLFSHGIYCLWLERFRWTKIVKHYIIANIMGWVAFIPWIVVIIQKLISVLQKRLNTIETIQNTDILQANILQSQSGKPPLSVYLESWLVNTARQFVDFGWSSATPSLTMKLSLPLLLSIVVLVIYALYFTQKTTDRKTFLFVITIVFIPWLILAIPDLIFGSTRSNLQRYLIPSSLGMQIAVAYLFSVQINSRKRYPVNPWKLITLVCFMLGIVSCGLSSQSQDWWNKRPDSHSLEVTAMVNRSPNALLMTRSYTAMHLGSLSYRLDPNIKVWLIDESSIKIPQGYEELFLYDPSKEMIQQIQSVYELNLEPVSESKNRRTDLNWLWRLNLV
ncbi:MAG: glycosyltransferase family 39 protein [Roseofilum sp. SBFL]|uniref:glycosyltransferase family 39 protein n=1 Tax=unclassified Roseofilum TaxID=2620099 RepID=UPI001B09FA03|nr:MULTISPECIES: glycosyltransferase family 39 protein [unclassified Roseofilum]MBP0014251.1 glycosyltransferase family 39 protein [Roseofilum sp. SID3]MBP0023760.1 glycosyltransferase family 39 protein [Roseofilum sp. SID2]MBP0038903.1 glycosyltransferase family 39 protein [Roseofilum sp. SID1]MBP0043747.1 glycosyltransferase family 39 protein [Roseofilum sp. SBFL]